MPLELTLLFTITSHHAFRRMFVISPFTQRSACLKMPRYDDDIVYHAAATLPFITLTLL